MPKVLKLVSAPPVSPAVPPGPPEAPAAEVVTLNLSQPEADALVALERQRGKAIETILVSRGLLGPHRYEVGRDPASGNLVLRVQRVVEPKAP